MKIMLWGAKENGAGGRDICTNTPEINHGDRATLSGRRLESVKRWECEFQSLRPLLGASIHIHMHINMHKETHIYAHVYMCMYT